MKQFKGTEIQPGKDWRIMFIGRSGSGKSTQGITFPGKKLMIDLDRRADAIKGAEVDIIQPDIGDGWTQIDPIIEKLVNLAKAKQFPYDTTIVASVTSAAKIFTQDSLKFVTAAADKKGDQEAGARKLGSLLIPGMSNYRYRAEAMEQAYAGMLLFPGNLILEAHVVDRYNKAGEVDGEGILGPDKFAEALPTSFSEVWYFYTRSVSSTSAKQFWVSFSTRPIARTAYKELATVGDLNITGKNLYEEVMKIIGGTNGAS